MTTRFKHIFSSLVVLFFIVLAIGSSTGKNATVSQEGGQIPPYFNPAKDTLLVIKDMLPGIGVGTNIKNAFKDYNGPYLIVNEKEVHSYDKDRYRYSFFLSTNASNITYANGKSGPGTVSCVIKDRKTDTNYRSVGVPDWGKLVKNYVTKLNGLIK